VSISLIGAATEAGPCRRVYRVSLHCTVSNGMLRSSTGLELSPCRVLGGVTLLALLAVDEYSSSLSLMIVGCFPLVAAKRILG
jgi:hypothetical protein